MQVRIGDEITKVANNLPTDLKDVAESILIMYMQLSDPTISTEDMIKIYNDPNPATSPYPNWSPTYPVKAVASDNSNPNATGPDLVFDQNGKLATGSSIQNTGTNSLRILIKGSYYNPQQLTTTRGSRFVMTRIGAYLAQKMGADPGTIITTGTYPQNSNEIPAFTQNLVISLNINGGFSKWFSNVSSFRSIIKHENFHKEDNEIPGFTSTLLTHAAVYVKQVKDVSFATTPVDFKVGIAKSFGNYLLNMDKSTNFTVSEILTKISEFNTNPFGMSIVRTGDPIGIY